MIAPDIPSDEPARQAALERYEILDTLPERAYDDVTALVALLCDAPVSLVGLIDRERNWLKSRHGVPMSESPRELSFCGHAIVSRLEIFTVEDARLDPRFADNPLVEEHGVVAYAGVPLVDGDGFALGTLCAFNVRPMVLDASRREAMQALARQVMYLLERHLRERELERTGRALAERNEELASFVGAVSHDIRSPVNNIVELARLIEDDAGEALGVDAREDVRDLLGCSTSLREYIDGLLVRYTAEGTVAEGTTGAGLETFRLDELLASLDRLVVRDARTVLVLPNTRAEIRAQRAGLQQVLLNLVANAVKCGTGESTRVEVRFVEREHDYRFEVADDGPGIAPERHESIFALFETDGRVARDGTGGTGIGLATVKRLLERSGGSIELDSAPGRGSTFSFTLPRPVAAKAAA